MSTIINLDELHRNEVASFNLTISEDGAPVSLTGLPISWKLYTYGDGTEDELIERSTGNGGVVIDPDQVTNIGKAVLHINVDVTDRAPRGYLHKLWVTDGGGDRVVAYGMLQILP